MASVIAQTFSLCFTHFWMAISKHFVHCLMNSSIEKITLYKNRKKHFKPNWSEKPFLKLFCWFIVFVRKMQVTIFYESKGPAWKKLYFFNKPEVLVMKVRYFFMNMVIFLGTHIFLVTWKWTCSQIIRSWLKIEDVFSATNGNDFGL